MVFLLIFPCQAISSEKTTSCAALLATQCLHCHSKTRICHKLKKKRGKRSWRRTIKSMVGYGAEVSRGEQKILIRCLAARAPEILSLCSQASN